MEINKLLISASNLIIENIPYLTELDNATGDGDHGVTMGKIAKKITEFCSNKIDLENSSQLFEDLSWELMNVNGGSAGPLWGAFFEGMASGAEIKCENKDEQIKNIFIEGYRNFLKLSKAKPGEKTMLDAIYPATTILQNKEGSFEEIIEDAANAALDGAESTKTMLAKYGRARSLGEKSIGHKDPGAVSFSLFYKGLALGLEEKEGR